MTAISTFALLDGVAPPRLDADGLARTLIAGGTTPEDVARAASVLFGSAVAQIGSMRVEPLDSISSAVNAAILTWLAPTMSAFGKLRAASRSLSSSAQADGTPAPRLTPREREVLDVLSKTADSPEVCAILNVSAHTLRHHITNLCGKFDARNRYELVLKAQRAGLV